MWIKPWTVPASVSIGSIAAHRLLCFTARDDCAALELLLKMFLCLSADRLLYVISACTATTANLPVPLKTVGSLTVDGKHTPPTTIKRATPYSPAQVKVFPMVSDTLETTDQGAMRALMCMLRSTFGVSTYSSPGVAQSSKHSHPAHGEKLASTGMLALTQTVLGLPLGRRRASGSPCSPPAGTPRPATCRPVLPDSDALLGSCRHRRWPPPWALPPPLTSDRRGDCLPVCSGRGSTLTAPSELVGESVVSDGE